VTVTVTVDTGVQQLLLLTACCFVDEKKRKDYAFWRQYNEKLSIIPGFPGCFVGACISNYDNMRGNTAAIPAAAKLRSH